MDATGAIILFAFIVFLVLLGVGGYFVVRTEAIRGWWRRYKEREAERVARQEEIYATRQREREVGIETGWPPDLILEGAVEWMTSNGWAPQNRTEQTASFARDQGADACLGCFLTLLFLLPGILYLLLANCTARVTVAAYPRARGSRFVIGGDEPNTMRMLSEVIRGLPETPPERVAKKQAPVKHSDQPSGTIAGKLLELNGLKEAGLIISEEFEAKKDLLDRM